MARSSFNNRLSKVLFPTLVLPTMATDMPAFIALPVSNEVASVAILVRISSAKACNSWRSAKVTSWSLKSSSSSISDVMCSNLSLSAASSPEKWPRSWPKANCALALLVAAMRSATASAWLKSIFPLRKARCVNSPGCACRHPNLTSSLSTSFSI